MGVISSILRSLLPAKNTAHTEQMSYNADPINHNFQGLLALGFAGLFGELLMLCGFLGLDEGNTAWGTVGVGARDARDRRGSGGA